MSNPIEPQGITTGNLVLLYRINNMNIELDLRLQNIVKHDHSELYKKSASKYADRQPLYPFDVIKNKYSDEQIEYGNKCYDYIISDYKLFQCSRDARKDLTDSRIDAYIEEHPLNNLLNHNQLIEILYYIENSRNKHIFGSLQFNDEPKETGKITKSEEQRIMSIFGSLVISIVDAYVETITDEFGDTYEDMYVVAEIYNQDMLNTLNEKLTTTLSIYDIQFSYVPNGYGRWGQTYDFYHYFTD